MRQTDFWTQFALPSPPRYEPQEPPWMEAPRPSEAACVDYWVGTLSRDFHVEQEVWGRHWTGRPARIDMLLHPRFDWPSGGRQPLGFEVKRPYEGVGEFTKAIGQAVDYAQSHWRSDFAPRMDPLVYVVVYDDFTTSDSEQVLLDRILGRLGVGMLRPHRWSGLALTTSGNTRWTMRYGSNNAAFSGVRRVGSR